MRRLFLLLCLLPAFSYGQNHARLRDMYMKFTDNSQWDSALVYAHKTINAAEKEFGKRSMEYYRAMNNIGYVYFERTIKDADSARYWWRRAFDESEDIPGEAIAITKGYLYRNLSAVYLEGPFGLDSVVYFTDRCLAVYKKDDTPEFLDFLGSKARDIHAKFGAEAAAKYYHLALDEITRLYGNESRVIIAGIDSILQSNPQTNNSGRRGRLYELMVDKLSLRDLDALSSGALRSANSWQGIVRARAYMDNGLKQKGSSSREFYTGLLRMGLIYHQWLKETDIAIFCLEKAVAGLREKRMEKNPVYAEVLDALNYIKRVPAASVSVLPVSDAGSLTSQPANKQTDELRLVLPIAHPWGVQYAEFSPDGKYVCSRSFNDVNAKIWDVATGSLLYNLALSGYVYAIEFSPDSRKLVASTAKAFAVFDLETGTLDWKRETPETVRVVRFSTDNTLLYAGTDDRLYMHNSKTGEMLKHLDFGAPVTSVLNREDGALTVFLTHKDGTLTCQIYNPETGKQQFVFDKKKVRTWISKNNIALFYEKDAVVYDLRTFKVSNIIDTFEDPADFALTPDGKRMLVTYKSDSVRVVFDTGTGDVISEWHFNELPLSISLLPDGKSYFSGESFGYAASRIDAVNGDVLEDIWGDTTSVSYNVAQFFNFSKDGRYMLQVFADNVIRIWDMSGKTAVLAKELSGKTRPLSDPILLNNGNHLAAIGADGYIKLFDLQLGVTQRVFRHFNSSIIKLKPDMQHLYSASSSKLMVWDIPQQRVLKEYDIKSAGLWSFDVSANEETVVIADFRDGKINLLNWRTGKMETLLKEDSVSQVKFHPVQQKLLITRNNKWFGLFDIATRKFDFKIPLNTWFFSINYAHGGKYIVTVDGSAVSVYNAGDGKLINSFKIINDVGTIGYAITADGKRIISGTMHGMLNIWDIEGGKLLTTQKVHDAGFEPRLTDNNEQLVTISNDGVIKVWDFADLRLIYEMLPIEINDHIVYTPSGYYKSSPVSAKYLHYLTKEKSIIGFDQLDVKYNRPDLVLGIMKHPDSTIISSYRMAYEKRIKRLGIDTTAFKAGFSLPEADFANRAGIATEHRSEELKLQVKGHDSAYQLDRFNVWVNDSPVFGLNGISLKQRRSKTIDTLITIKLSQGRNTIETSVTNVNGGESYRKPLVVNYLPDVAVAGKVWFIGIGVAKFADTAKNLLWSMTDIHNLDDAFRAKYKGQYRSRLLLDADVTNANVAGLKKLLRDSTGVNDKVIISYSGHGILSKDLDYFLSTYAVDFEKPEVNGLPYDSLENLTDGIAARRKLLLIDACNSGELDKDEAKQATPGKIKADAKGIELEDNGLTKTAFELMQEIFMNVGRATGTTIISASNGTKPAYEKTELKGGVFTYSILQKLKEDKPVKISALKQHLSQMVPKLTNGEQKPTIRGAGSYEDWVVW